MNEDFCKWRYRYRNGKVVVGRIFFFNKFALYLIRIEDRFWYIHIFNKLIVVKYTVYSYIYIIYIYRHNRIYNSELFPI